MKRLIALLLISLLSVALIPDGFAYGQGGERSKSLVTIDGIGYYVHTVQRGETLYSLARLYEVAQDEIIKNNPLAAEGLQEGSVLKIPARLEESAPRLSARKQQRTFDVHYVNKGETLYSISRRYEIPVNTLLEDNPGLDPAQLSIGQGLNIRKKSKGEASPEEIEEQITEYRDAINSLPTGFIYHIVERGETIFGLSKMYDVTESDILSNNNIPDGLKAGDMIKIPSREGQKPIVDIDFPEEGTRGEDVIPGWDSYYTPGDFTGEVSNFTGTPRVAVMLPLKNGDNAATNFVEFYQGFLLGLEDLKNDGVTADVVLHNTARSSSVVYGITESEDFEGTNLIIGPIYEENMPAALHYAQRHSIPVVSPLAPMSGVGSPLLYQMAPDRSTKYEKLRSLLTEEYNVIFISNSKYRDEEMEGEIKPLLPPGYHNLITSGALEANQVSNFLDKTRDNLIFISCTNGVAADQIMATISSVQSNLVARSIAGGGVRVVVTPRWSRFSGVDRNLYFKLNLCYITNYHADRGSTTVRLFDSRFISAYGTIPTQYAYRGYDAAKLFIGTAARGGNFDTELNSGRIPLLQMSYRFARSGNYGTMVNGEWAFVCYHNDYTIEVR